MAKKLRFSGTFILLVGIFVGIMAQNFASPTSKPNEKLLIQAFSPKRRIKVELKEGAKPFYSGAKPYLDIYYKDVLIQTVWFETRFKEAIFGDDKTEVETFELSFEQNYNLLSYRAVDREDLLSEDFEIRIYDQAIIARNGVREEETYIPVKNLLKIHYYSNPEVLYGKFLTGGLYRNYEPLYTIGSLSKVQVEALPYLLKGSPFILTTQLSCEQGVYEAKKRAPLDIVLQDYEPKDTPTKIKGPFWWDWVGFFIGNKEEEVLNLVGKISEELITPKYSFSYEPGLSIWNQEDDGRGVKKQKEYADYISSIGGKWVLIDSGWYANPYGGDPTRADPRLYPKGMKDFISYCHRRNINVLLWIDWDSLERYGIEHVLDIYEKWGVDAVKVDFLFPVISEANKDSAEVLKEFIHFLEYARTKEMGCFVHGARVFGLDYRYPNLLGQEGVFGEEQGLKQNQPNRIASMGLMGYAKHGVDFTPGSFDLHWHESGDGEAAKNLVGTKLTQIGMMLVSEKVMPQLSGEPSEYKDDPLEPFVERLGGIKYREVIKSDLPHLIEFYVITENGRNLFISFTDSPGPITVPIGKRLSGRFLLKEYYSIDRLDIECKSTCLEIKKNTTYQTKELIEGDANILEVFPEN